MKKRPVKSNKPGGQRSRPGRSSSIKVQNKTATKQLKRGGKRKARVDEKLRSTVANMSAMPAHFKRSSLVDDHAGRKRPAANDNTSSDSDSGLDEETLRFYRGRVDNYETGNAAGVCDAFIKSSLDASQQFEQEPRSHFKSVPSSAGKRQLLPIKTADGSLVLRSTDKGEDGSEGEDEQRSVVDHDDSADAATESRLSDGQQYLLSRHEFPMRRRQIALCAHQIVSSPEENLGLVKQLQDFMSNDPSQRVRCLATISLAEVFCDILPEFRIKPASGQSQKSNRMQKETRIRVAHEQLLLAVYRRFLTAAEQLVKSQSVGQKKGSSKRRKTMRKTKQFYAAVFAFSRLLLARPAFNFTGSVVTLLTPLLNEPTDDCVEDEKQTIPGMVQHTFAQVFEADRASGTLTLEVVRAVNRFVRETMGSGGHVSARVFDVFLSLPITEVDRRSQQERRKERMSHKQRMAQLSRKERKRLKHKEKLEEQLEAASAKTRQQHLLQLHTDTVEQMFFCYFRVLNAVCSCFVDEHGTDANARQLLAAVLRGLAKFAHLINVDFFDDLFGRLSRLMESDTLSVREQIDCAQCAFTLLSNEGSALQIDPDRFYVRFLQVLRQLVGQRRQSTLFARLDIILQPLIDCLDMMLISRKRYVSSERFVAFTNLLCALACKQQLPDDGRQLLVDFIRRLCSKVAPVAVIFQSIANAPVSAGRPVTVDQLPLDLFPAEFTEFFPSVSSVTRQLRLPLLHN